MDKNNIKKSIICQFLKQEYEICTSIIRQYQPKSGDLAVFEVLELGKHPSIQGLNGNNTYIFPGDTIMMAFGNRYATEQFEGYIPRGYREEYHILGKGGAVGVVASMHYKMELRGPTTLRLIGYVCDPTTGAVLNTKKLAGKLLPFNPDKPRPYRTILSLGTGMDSGKTTTAGYLARGLMLANQTVAYIKLTGTVYTKDRSFVRDCGATCAVDFSSVGFPSTYMTKPTELLNLYETLLQKVEEEAQPDFVIIEIADGLLQRETTFLLKNKDFQKTIDHIALSSVDSMGILQGIQWLRKNIKRYPDFLSGLFTAAPLLIKEAKRHTRIPILTLEALSHPSVLDILNRHKAKHNGQLTAKQKEPQSTRVW